MTCATERGGRNSPHMNRGTSTRAVVAAIAAASFFCTIALSASPQLHNRLHADAHRIQHACAVTLMSSGSCEHVANLPLVVRPHYYRNLSKLPPLAPHKIKSAFLLASIFEHAPPARS